MDSRIFTTEPLAMRALAAELRFHADVAESVFSELVQADLGRLQSVRCEDGRRGNLDVVLIFANGEVGVEGKIGHAVTSEQLHRENATVDYLVVLVKDAADVGSGHGIEGLVITTWKDMLSHFPASRITLADIDAVNDATRIARRSLNGLVVPPLPADWGEVERSSTGSGYPSLVFRSPELPGGRNIVVQVEADRGSMPERFLANVGISVFPADFAEEGDSSTMPEPAWITYVRALGTALEKGAAGTSAAISRNAGRGTSGNAAVKIQQAKKFGLPLHYATGYTDSYVGVRTGKVGPEMLQDLLEILTPLVVDAYTKMRS